MHTDIEFEKKKAGYCTKASILYLTKYSPVCGAGHECLGNSYFYILASLLPICHVPPPGMV